MQDEVAASTIEEREMNGQSERNNVRVNDDNVGIHRQMSPGSKSIREQAGHKYK